MDRYLLSVERMPRVKHFGRFGFMGVPSLGCTTGIVRTVRSPIERPMNLLRSSRSNNRNQL